MKFWWGWVRFSMADRFIYEYEQWLDAYGVDFKIVGSGVDHAKAFMSAINQPPVMWSRDYKLYFPNKGIEVLHKLTWGGK